MLLMIKTKIVFINESVVMPILKVFFIGDIVGANVAHQIGIHIRIEALHGVNLEGIVLVIFILMRGKD